MKIRIEVTSKEVNSEGFKQISEMIQGEDVEYKRKTFSVVAKSNEDGSKVMEIGMCEKMTIMLIDFYAGLINGMQRITEAFMKELEAEEDEESEED